MTTSSTRGKVRLGDRVEDAGGAALLVTAKQGEAMPRGVEAYLDVHMCEGARTGEEQQRPPRRKPVGEGTHRGKKGEDRIRVVRHVACEHEQRRPSTFPVRRGGG